MRDMQQIDGMVALKKIHSPDWLLPGQLLRASLTERSWSFCLNANVFHYPQMDLAQSQAFSGVKKKKKDTNKTPPTKQPTHHTAVHVTKQQSITQAFFSPKEKKNLSEKALVF